MDREKELLEKLEQTLKTFASMQISVGASPIIGRVVEVLGELGAYLKSKVTDDKEA